MSTIKVTNIQNPSAPSAAVVLDTNGQATLNGLAYPTAGPLSNRNLIINGAMQVAQRGTQVTGVTTGGYKTCDRFDLSMFSLGTWTVDQSTDAPEGFSNSFKLTCTTADASPVSNASAYLLQRIEAQNLQHLKFGTANALPLVVSFWVKSNKTGAASFDARQPDASDRIFSQSYTINAANTWEYKTISIPGDTLGQIDNDNGIGIYIGWWLNSGTDSTGGSHQTSWGSLVSANRNVSNLGVGGAISDYFAITGVQLEVGTVATPFEHRSYSDELARCQRYYYKITLGSSSEAFGSGFNESTTQGRCSILFPVPMRAEPTALEQTGIASDYRVLKLNTSELCSSVPVYAATGSRTAGVRFIVASGLSAGHGSICAAATADAYLAWSAEL